MSGWKPDLLGGDGDELAAGEDAEPLAAPDDGVAEEGHCPDGDLEEVFQRRKKSSQA